MAQRHTDQELDDFQAEAFRYIRNYFEASAEALKERNPGVDFRIKDDGQRFETTIYRDGASVASCAVFPHGMMGRSIAYGPAGSMGRNSMNEILSVQADDRGIFLTTSGMASMTTNQRRDARLTMDGSAELFWGMLVRPLQPRGF